MKSFFFWPLLPAVLDVVGVIVKRVAADEEQRNPDGSTPIPNLTARNVEGYAYEGCTDKEIADRFLVDEELIRTQFGEVLRATRGFRAYRLRKAQTKEATDGNSTQLIWLGRNELGQTTNRNETREPEPNEP
jgi:hypothetical protein